MGVRNSGPVVDCLTPVGWQVQMVREKGNGCQDLQPVTEKEVQAKTVRLINTAKHGHAPTSGARGVSQGDMQAGYGCIKTAQGPAHCSHEQHKHLHVFSVGSKKAQRTTEEAGPILSARAPGHIGNRRLAFKGNLVAMKFTGISKNFQDKWEERGALQEAATLATASATPLRAHMVRRSGWGRAGEALTQQAAAQSSKAKQMQYSLNPDHKKSQAIHQVRAPCSWWNEHGSGAKNGNTVFQSLPEPACVTDGPVLLTRTTFFAAVCAHSIGYSYTSRRKRPETGYSFKEEEARKMNEVSPGRAIDSLLPTCVAHLLLEHQQKKTAAAKGLPRCCNPSYSRSPPLTYLAQASRKQDVAINGNSQSPPHGLWPGTTSGSHIALEKQASEYTHFTDSVLHELYYLGQKKRKKVVAEKALQCTLEVNPADVLEKYEQVRIDMPGLARDGMATSAKQL
ncbi:hypothetical protein Anapl_06886 [Anas platyrhynchos]|uniref:Uncharacterized protein n=1 Tax=Anas platyrhynchos TaxID=8839 RepID=R0JV86_ANAPL|nr:hypothetical protein Anapl_06886 [Anas platyrhynchos]